MSLNKLNNFQPPEPQFPPALTAALRRQLDDLILNQPLERVSNFFNNPEVPLDFLKGLESWNVPFQLLINGDTEKLQILFSFGLQTSVTPELVRVRETWMTKLSLLAIAVLEESEEAVHLILDRVPEDNLEEQYCEVFDRTENQPLSVEKVLEGLKVYDPERSSRTLKQYTPAINAERLTEVFAHSEPAHAEDEESTLSVYQLAKICNSPPWVISLLEEYDCDHGDIWPIEWSEEAANNNLMIPTDQYI